MFKRILFFSLLIVTNFTILHAQEKDSILSIIANDYGQEKMFIHFDKSIYNKAETIWFKAYLQNGNLPSTISKNFYADWYNDSGTLLQHNVFPIFQSSANGQFVVPDDYKGKAIHIKAYTTWMLNFDTSFLYNKNITILQTNNAISLAKNIKPQLHFFAEGGNLINGLNGFVAFKATDQFLNPIKINGVIKNNKNELIDSIKTDHDGMGIIYIANADINNNYTAFWQDEITNTQHNTALPMVVEDGVALQVQNMSNKLIVNIARQNNASDDKKMLHLFCFMNNMRVYEAQVKMLSKTTQSIEIPTNLFGTGVVQVSVFNANHMPLAERVVFVNNNDYEFNTYINVAAKNLNKRGKNVVEITVDDSAYANMSVAITDATMPTDSTSNPFSHLLLAADVKGHIYNVNQYFLNNNDSTQQYLDLVMLTNGWRKYNWQKIFNNQKPLIRYLKDTSYLNIIGNTYGELGNLQPQQQIIIFAETVDSLRKQFILPVNKKGIFGNCNFIFYGKLKLSYSFLGNKKLNADAEVIFQNGLYNRQSKYYVDSLLQSVSAIDVAFLEKMKRYDEEYKRLSKLKGSGMLEAVTVESKKRSAKDILDNKYASNLFAGGDAYQFDVMNDMRGQSAIDVFHYLTGMVAGLQINTNGGETTVKWRGANTDFFLDEMKADAEMVGNISMSEIAYVKVFRPPFFGGAGGSTGGAIAIYTRKGGDVKSTPGKGLAFKYLDGYTITKQFYSPNYETENSSNADVRTTLYWNPYITTNHTKHKATIEFFNNDFAKKYRIVLCGVNADGKITRIEKMVE